ncbi:DNA (cytosine-5)-methyltransferase CMT1-like [Lolium rigidum]|uniref:DNA (cytosine-5)-methyltransferase CMT1-like n=1 Tax=Lolium rigidum TaxID=89674 RepID=UPI001F5CCF2F|nr:DNA (cytosine-5)-methyltransferase CMT1-like [Lolium rigidum]
MSSPSPERRRSTRPRPKLSYADADSDDEPERGGKRRRNAGVKPGARKGGKAKGEPKRRRRLAEAPAMMEEEGGAIDDDMCASEPDAEEMRRQEEEEVEAALLEAEEQAKAGTLRARRKRKVATRRRTGLRREGASESDDHFVGDPMPDDEARRRWPEKYKPKDSDGPKASTKKKRSNAVAEEEKEKRARCHYRSAIVEGATFDLGDDVYVRAPPGEDDYIGRITEFFQGIEHKSYFCCRWFYRVADTVITPKLLEVPDHEHDHKRVFLSEEKDDNLIESIISKVKITYVAPNLTQQEKAELISNSDLYYDMAYSVAYSTFANVPPENGGPTGSETTSDISCDNVDSSMEKAIADLPVPPDAQMETATLLDLYSGCGAMSTGLCQGAPLSGLKLTTKWAVDMNEYACDSLKHNHPRTHVRTEKAENFLKLLQEWDKLCKEYDVHNSTCLPRILNDDEDDENGVNEPLLEGTFEVEKLVDICYGDPNKIETDGLWFKVRWKTYDSSHDTWEPLDGLRDSPECIKDFVESGYRESILPLPVLPKFPLPTHVATKRGQHVPTKFSQCLVACDETESKLLDKALFLKDAIDDLPEVENHQPKDVMAYKGRPNTDLQRYIRLNRKDMGDNSLGDSTPKEGQLFDHQPLELNKDDYQRGANFRDLKGVRVPDYAMTFVKGRSLKPFGRLWWDETVSTVVTRAEPHNQAILHPNQNRVLTVRENARLQGFPDYYRLFGPIKQKYIQVGNAVAVPVARALGYSLGQAYQQGEFSGEQRPLFKLPGNFVPAALATATRLPQGSPAGEVCAFNSLNLLELSVSLNSLVALELWLMRSCRRYASHRLPEQIPDAEACSDNALGVGGQESARHVDVGHRALPGEAVALTEHQDSAREGNARDDAGS